MKKRSWSKKLMVLVLLAIIILFAFKNVVFSRGKLLCPEVINDVNSFFYSGWYLNAKIFKLGIPLWNPFRLCGEPWFANPQNQFFYPPYLVLFLFLRPHLGINYSFIFHILLAGYAMYLFARSIKIGQFGGFVSALVFMLSPMVFLRCFAGHLNTLCAYAYLPLIFLFVEMGRKRRLLKYILFAALTLAFQILAGNPQYTFYTILAVCLYLGYWAVIDFLKTKNFSSVYFCIKSLLIQVFVGVGLAAVKLFPNIELAGFSSRRVKSIDFVGSWSLPPENLLTVFFPEIFGNIINFPYFGKYNYWEMCAYVGIFTLGLSLIALCGKRNKHISFFFLLAIVGIFSALSIHTLVFYLYYNFLPGFSWFRGHNKFLVLFIFAVSILSGFGCRFLLRKKDDLHLKKVKGISMVFIGIALCCLFLLHSLSKANGGITLQLFQKYLFIFVPERCSGLAYYTLLHSLKRGVFLFISTGGIFFFFAAGRIRRFSFKMLIIFFLLFELLSFGTKFLKTTPIRNFFCPEDIVRFFKEEKELFRVGGLETINFLANNFSLDEIQSISGYEPLRLADFTRYFNRFRYTYVNNVVHIQNVQLLNAANLKFMILPKGYTAFGFTKVFAGESADVFKNEDCWPRAFIVYNPVREVRGGIFFEPENVSKAVHQNIRHVKVYEYGLHKVVLEAQLDRDGFLVLADAFYPGWTALVHAKDKGRSLKRKIIRVNSLFRGIFLTKGNYIVKFIFRPILLYVGCFISLLSLFIVLFMIFRLKNFKL